jgi:PAS domain S-box-containing protein
MSKILIVDDERSIRITLTEFLRDAGYLVVAEDDLSRALRLVESETFDIVVTDILLPGGSGLQLLHKLRTEQPACLVLVITGQPSMETAVEAVHDGAHDYLLKPISKEIILRAVGKADQLLQLQKDKRQLEIQTRRHQEILEETVRARTHSLAESQALYQSLVEHLPQFILRSDLEGRYTFANQKFCDYVGMPARAIVGLSDRDLFTEEITALYEKRIREVMNAGRTLEQSDPLQLRGGPARHFHFIRTPLLDSSGKMIGLQCIFWDTTEQEATASQLRKLARAVEQSPVSIIITDKDGLIEFANPKFTQVTGYTLPEVLGKTPRVLKSGETPAADYRHLWETIRSGQEWRGEVHNRRKDGTLYWETLSISPIRDGSGEITHFIAVKEDTTEKKLLERQFQRAQRLENLGSLASGIAHDLNNILTPIVMCAPLLKAEMPEEERLQLLSTVESSAKRAEGIVKQLLVMGRGREGGMGPLQIRHLITEIEKIVRETFPKSICIGVACDDSLHSIKGDPTQIHQILMNLLVNARDALPKEGGRITISASNVYLDEHYTSMHREATAGHYVRLSVTDNGSGIPEAIQQRIFDPFFTTKGPDSGTGLGLTNVLGIVKNHHGFILLQSTLGKGTTFEINLPALPDSEKTDMPETTEQEAPRGSGELIMVVDDEPAIRHAAQRTLVQAGYEVVLAEDGIDALAYFTRNARPVNLLVTDWYMPGMDGAMLCKTLHRLRPDLPIVVSTGAAIGESASQIERILSELSIRLLLHKPHTADVLLKAIFETLHPTAPCKP